MRQDGQDQRRRHPLAPVHLLAILVVSYPLAIAQAPQSAASNSDLTALAVTESVRPLGRFHQQANKALVFAWPGSGFELDFEGTRLEATLNDAGKTWLEIEVNGATRALALQAGSHRYVIADVAPGHHRVRVTRRTEARSGRTVLLDLQADGRAVPTAESDRRLMVIGDSISAGYGAEGKGPHCRFSFATENHNLGYAALAARAFGADLHSIAISGQGLLPKAGKPQAKTMAEMHHLVFPRGEPWRSTRFQPAAIIVHLGTNDFYGRNPHKAFVAAYLRLLEDLAVSYPDARLYAAIGPMLAGADRKHAEDALADALDLYSEGGARPVRFLSFQPAKRGHIHGCNWHPGRDSHARMAQKLIKSLTDDLGWKAAPLVPASAASKP